MLFYACVSQEKLKEFLFVLIYLPVADHLQLLQLAAWYLHYVTGSRVPE